MKNSKNFNRNYKRAYGTQPEPTPKNMPDRNIIAVDLEGGRYLHATKGWKKARRSRLEEILA